MKILITGIAGAIGSNVAEHLRLLGHDVVGVDCLTDYYDPRIKSVTVNELKKAGCEIHPHDLATDDLAEIVSGADIIFHFAAQPGLSSSVPFNVFVKDNILATHNLLEASRKSDKLKLFINISTSSVYGERAEGDENSEPKPTSSYGVTKLAAEQLAMSYFREFGLPVVSLRLFSVYGERERPEKLYHKLIKSILEEKEFPLHEGADNHYRSYTHVSDVVEACVLVLDNVDKVKGEIFNIGNDKFFSTGEGIKTIERIIGKDAIIKTVPRRGGDQKETSANIEKAKRILGYNPKISLEEGLKREVDWYKKNIFGNEELK